MLGARKGGVWDVWAGGLDAGPRSAAACGLGWQGKQPIAQPRSPGSHPMPLLHPPPLPHPRCRFKVERYMQVVFGLSALMLFVPVLYHQTATKDVAPGSE